MASKYYFIEKGTLNAITNEWKNEKLDASEIYTDAENALSKVKQLAKSSSTSRRYRIRVAFLGDDGKICPQRGKPHRWWSIDDVTKENK